MRARLQAVSIAAGFVTLLSSCAPTPRESAPGAPPAPTAASNATEQATPLGRYEGTLPCADCSGIRTELTLLVERSSGAPATYGLRETRLGTAEGDRAVESSGRWTIVRGSASDAGAVVFQIGVDGIEEPRRFLKVSENELRLLDREHAELDSTTPHSLIRENRAAAPLSAELTERDDGRKVELRAGEEIVIKLPSNRRMGYAWGFNDRNVGVLELVGEPGYAESAGPEASGEDSWRLRAVKTGTTTLGFEYVGPSEVAAKPERSLTYSVTVR